MLLTTCSGNYLPPTLPTYLTYPPTLLFNLIDITRRQLGDSLRWHGLRGRVGSRLNRVRKVALRPGSLCVDGRLVHECALEKEGDGCLGLGSLGDLEAF